jgi:hypothetical protein
MTAHAAIASADVVLSRIRERLTAEGRLPIESDETLEARAIADEWEDHVDRLIADQRRRAAPKRRPYRPTTTARFMGVADGGAA